MISVKVAIYLIYVSTFKIFLLSLSSIHRKNMLFLPQREIQRGGGNCPFSHKHKLMSLISLYNFIANISFLMLLVNYFIFSSRERKWKRNGRKLEEGPKGRVEKYNGDLSAPWREFRNLHLRCALKTGVLDMSLCFSHATCLPLPAEDAI